MPTGVYQHKSTQGFQKNHEVLENWGFQKEHKLKSALGKHWKWTEQSKENNPYPENWSKQKEIARERDNYMCQECGICQIKLNKKLDVHHIDYNKKN
jgi:hypothetical protein